MKKLQKLGAALMLPVAVLPICGILMGIGYFLCPASMQGGHITGFWPMIGEFLVQAGGAVINNIAILFAVGVGVGLSKDHDGTGGIAALVSWLMITTLLNADFVKTILPSVGKNASQLLAFQKIQNPFIGILAGVIGAVCFNRFKDTKLPDWLGFFSGKRSVAIVASLISIVVSAILLIAWPLLFTGLVALGKSIAKMGAFGAAIYAVLNKLLLPFGLHHALNNVFWFDTIGLGDLTHFWAGDTSKQVGWSLGMYMSGFFPCMMFGIPGAALAMIQTAKTKQKKVAIGVLSSAALCAFVCGITEPFEFSFLFAAPVLYVVYALLYGVFTYITVISGFRAGFSFSAGLTDLIFSSSLPAAQKTWLIIPLGIAAFVVFYLVFRFMIVKFNFKTPGREDDDEFEEESAENDGDEVPVDDKYERMAETILEGLGGVDNITSATNCTTRLRLEVKDRSIVDDKKIKSSGAVGVMKPGKTSVQVIIGTNVQFVADALQALLAGKKPVQTTSKINQNNEAEKVEVKSNDATLKVSAIADGKLTDLSQVNDPVFSQKMMGDGFAIVPASSAKCIYAPITGEIVMLAETGHAVGIRNKDGVEVLAHIGLDTVKLEGKGFKPLVKVGDHVEMGQVLIEFDQKAIKNAGLDSTIMTVFTAGFNGDLNLSKNFGEEVNAKDLLIEK